MNIIFNSFAHLIQSHSFQAKQKIRQFHQQQQQQQQQQLQEPPRFESQNDVQDSKAAKVDEGLAFEPKVVVEFNVEEPIFDVTMLKKKIKAAVMEPVKYIDARPGDNVDQARFYSIFQSRRTLYIWCTISIRLSDA